MKYPVFNATKKFPQPPGSPGV